MVKARQCGTVGVEMSYCIDAVSFFRDLAHTVFKKAAALAATVDDVDEAPDNVLPMRLDRVDHPQLAFKQNVEDTITESYVTRDGGMIEFDGKL